MVEVSVEGGNVVFNVQGMDKLWSFKSRIEIPIAHVTKIEYDPESVGRWWHGFKVVGAEMPGLFAMGTFYYHGEMVFWDVRHPKRTIVVSLEHERYKKLIVEVAEPEETVALVRAAMP